MPARVDKAMADGSAIKGSEDAMQRCNELEAELAELRAAYDQYFMGNERVPPQKKHEGFKKQYMKLKSTQVRQTAVKFRIESIGQKLLTFERLWERTLQQIEAGTYKRDLMRLKRHQKDTRKTGSDDADFHIDEDLDLSDLDEEGGDDLASALAAAEASANARAAAPAIKPVTPVIAPVAAPVPAVAAPPPPRAVPAGLQPLTAPIPAPKPSGPPKLTAAIPTSVAPALKPVITAATPALKPVSSPGSNPAIKQPAPSKPPPASTGSSPALRPAATGSNPALKSAPPRPPAAANGEGGLSDTKVKAIYDAYVMAKKRCGEDTRSVTLDSVATSLRKQVPELMKQHNAKTVEFKVVIKDGKAVLRALPKD